MPAIFFYVSHHKFQRQDEDCESAKMGIVDLVDKCLYTTVAERQSCKLKVLCSFPSAESCDAPQPAFTGQAKGSGVPAVSPIPNLRLLAGRNVGHSAKVSPT
jgi:hypothetical protein